jgi:hypothetical protein
MNQGGAATVCSHDRSQARLVIVAASTPDVSPVVSPVERILLPLVHRVLQNGHNVCRLFSSGSGNGLRMAIAAADAGKVPFAYLGER